MLITAILFVVILSVLVFVHELGHFIAAKLSGMRVDEFGLGFPPTLFSWKRGETKYALNLLPIGGYVKIFGENPDEAVANGLTAPRSFTSRPRHLQVIVLIAGVTFNILFAWMVTSAGFLSGLPVSADSYTNELLDVHIAITEVVPESIAEKAGFKAGDEVQFFETKSDALYPNTSTEIVDFLSKHGGEKITVHYKRGGTANTASVTLDQAHPVLGVGLSAVGMLKLSPVRAVIEGGKATYYATINTATSIFDFLGKAITGTKGSLSGLSGPVGIAELVGSARRLGLGYFITFVSYISINLAIINLLPFPALDGGRILFVIIESIIRRPIPAKFTNIVNATGFIVLISFMVIITYHDILKFFF